MTRPAIAMLPGTPIGQLTVLARAPSDPGDAKKRARWLCRCSCGNTCVAVGSYLRRGLTRSCGCLRRKTFIANLHEGRRRAMERARNQPKRPRERAAAKEPEESARTRRWTFDPESANELQHLLGCVPPTHIVGARIEHCGIAMNEPV